MGTPPESISARVASPLLRSHLPDRAECQQRIVDRVCSMYRKLGSINVREDVGRSGRLNIPSLALTLDMSYIRVSCKALRTKIDDAVLKSWERKLYFFLKEWLLQIHVCGIDIIAVDEAVLTAKEVHAALKSSLTSRYLAL